MREHLGWRMPVLIQSAQVASSPWGLTAGEWSISYPSWLTKDCSVLGTLLRVPIQGDPFLPPRALWRDKAQFYAQGQGLGIDRWPQGCAHPLPQQKHLRWVFCDPHCGRGSLLQQPLRLVEPSAPWMVVVLELEWPGTLSKADTPLPVFC